MPEENDPDSSIRAKSKRLKEQISAWSNRAAMARQQGMADLEQQALGRKSNCEDELAKLQEFEMDNS
jgi:phage shock protein A